MATKDALIAARHEAGLTQAELAKRIFVTRQAVSRWERGETTPSVDTLKLIARELGVSAARLLDLPQEPTCQCCGTPFSVPHMPCGTDADGTENPSYCKWCYDKGTFASETMDDVIEHSAPYLVEATGMSLDEAVSFMGIILPTLDRWREAGATEA